MKYIHKILIVLINVSIFAKFTYAQEVEKKVTVKKQALYEDYEQENSKDDYYEDDEPIARLLPSDCIEVQYLKLKRICTAFYPEDIKDTYNDEFIEVNDAYSVFQFPDEDTNRYFMTFQRSPLHRCNELQVMDLVNYVCINSQGNKTDVKVQMGLMKCLEGQSDMIDDLLISCSPKGLESSVFAAMHYADLRSTKRSSGDHLTVNMLTGLGLLGLTSIIIVIYQYCTISKAKLKTI